MPATTPIKCGSPNAKTSVSNVPMSMHPAPNSTSVLRPNRPIRRPAVIAPSRIAIPVAPNTEPKLVADKPKWV
ncbi:hypothetical protein D3C87_1959680 [compost metagenome]